LVFNGFRSSVADKGVDVEQFFELVTANPYNEDTGFGFYNIGMEDGKVNAKLLKRSNSYVNEVDTQTFETSRKQIAVFTSVSFDLDFNLDLITVYGSQTQLNLLKSAFRNLNDFTFEANVPNLSLTDFSVLLERHKVKFSIDQITIKNFNYKDGMVGRFSGEINKQSLVNEIIGQYDKDIIKATFVLTISQKEKIILQLLPSGNLKILCEEDEVDYYINFLKQLIFNNG